MRSTEHTTRLAGLTAALLGIALILSACGGVGMGESIAAGGADTREALPAASELPDPRTVVGMTEAKTVAEIVPIDDNPAPALPVTLTDADGFDVTVEDTSRIIPLDLYGTYSSTLVALGMADSIVGRTVSSQEKQIADRPVVTQNGHNINVEAVLQLDPSLIIADHTIGPREALEQLRSAGVPVVILDPERTLESVGEDIRTIGDVVGLTEKSAELAERAQEELLADIDAIGRMLPQEPLRMAFLYVRGNGGIFFVLGEGSGADQFIGGIGGRDMASEVGIVDVAPANAEALVDLDPEVILVMQKGLESTGGIDGLLSRPGVAETTAGRNSRIVAIPDGQALTFGPLAGAGLVAAAQAVYNPDGITR